MALDSDNPPSVPFTPEQYTWLRDTFGQKAPQLQTDDATPSGGSTPQGSATAPSSGAPSASIGAMPDPASLPALPVFSPITSVTQGLDLLAAAASSTQAGLPSPKPPTVVLTAPGPYNPAASLPPKVAKKILNLEFVEMSELSADIWMDEPSAADTGHVTRRPTNRPPVTDIKIWLECFSRMAALLVTHFPEKGPELWAYQTTILRAAHNYEGYNWVAYDRQFRRNMLAQKDLNWSSPNARLYNEAFTGRAKIIPQCPHYCLCEDHAGAICPHNPNPPLVGWFSDPRQLVTPAATASLPSLAQPQGGGSHNEICRNYNENRCRLTRCRFQHTCHLCFGPHPAMVYPRKPAPHMGAPLIRGHSPFRGRQGRGHPYFTGQRRQY